jgi:hypothetical protein
MSRRGEAFALFIPVFKPVTLAGGPDLQAVSVLDVHRVGERDENGMSEVMVIVHAGHQVTKRIPTENVIQIKVTTRAQISKLQETAEEALRAKEKLLVQTQTLQDVLAAHRGTEAHFRRAQPRYCSSGALPLGRAIICVFFHSL